jgi:hypothetical protein
MRQSIFNRQAVPGIKSAACILLVLPAIASAQSSRLPYHPPVETVQKMGGPAPTGDEKKPTPCPQRNFQLFPTSPYCLKDPTQRDPQINAYYGTADQLSFFGQIKSIYNGASSSTTVSADIASMNFSNGMQLTASTNIQAGSPGSPTTVAANTMPTLTAAAAAQATQNVLYGGTLLVSDLYPIFSYGAGTIGTADGLGMTLNAVAREGIDLQSFTPGTTVQTTAPSSHGSFQLESYLQYNSTKKADDKVGFTGAVFVGGAYGYSYTSHGYARDYGFGNNVNAGVGQVSAGILINGVAKIAVLRAFGPSQTYLDSTSLAPVTVNNFKAWSFGITYQAPPAN